MQPWWFWATDDRCDPVFGQSLITDVTMVMCDHSLMTDATLVVFGQSLVTHATLVGRITSDNKYDPGGVWSFTDNSYDPGGVW